MPPTSVIGEWAARGGAHRRIVAALLRQRGGVDLLELFAVPPGVGEVGDGFGRKLFE